MAFTGKKRSEETKKKISIAKTGEKHPMYGKHHSEETKKKMSIANSGENNPMYGKKRSEETKKKMSIANTGEKHPMYGKHHSEETKKKMSIANSGKKHSEETKKKISIAHSGEKRSEESKKKQGMVNSGENNPNWKGGIATLPYCPTWHDKGWRELIKERDVDRFCWNPLCSGKGSKQNLHHINYDKMDCDLRNIITVCNSCNSRANGDRVWWESFYTEIMVQRYTGKGG